MSNPPDYVSTGKRPKIRNSNFGPITRLVAVMFISLVIAAILCIAGFVVIFNIYPP
jgi:hypothetical protein